MRLPGNPTAGFTRLMACIGAAATLVTPLAGQTTESAKGGPATLSIEQRETSPPAGFKLPFADAMYADDVEPGKRGGSFTYVAFGDGPKTFDPVSSNDSGSNEVIIRMFSALIEFDNKKQDYVPGIAKAWYMEDDKRNWIIKLRDCAKWSDGKPIAADDVLFSAEVVYSPTVRNAAKDVLQVNGKPFVFEKVDDHTVRARLDKPSASFPALVSSMPIIAKHAYEKAFRDGKYEQALNIDVKPETVVVSGPFRLKEYQSGERVILERNPHFMKFDKNGTQLPYLDTLIITYAPDMNQMIARFKSGTADGFIRPAPAAVADLVDGQAKGNYHVYDDLGPGDGANVFWFNLKEGSNKDTGRPFVDPVKFKWFSDPRFRRAAMHAIDKDSIINTELRKLALSVWSLESPAIKFWHNPDVAKYPYDPDKAGALLDEMGLRDRDGDGIREDESGNKVQFTFVTNKGNTVRQKVADLMAADWRNVGIDAKPQFLEFNTLVTKTADTFDYDACLLGFGGGGTHPANSMNVYLSSGRTHFFNPQQEKPQTEWEKQVDAWAQDFNATLDVQEQRAIFNKMQAKVAEMCAFLPLWTSRVVVVARNSFGNLKPSPLTHELLWNADEIYAK